MHVYLAVQALRLSRQRTRAEAAGDRQLIDSGVDYVNRDGISAQSILHSYRYITLRQQELTQLGLSVRTC